MAQNGLRFLNMLYYSSFRMFSFTRSTVLGTWIPKTSRIPLVASYVANKHILFDAYHSRCYSTAEVSHKQEIGCPICRRNLTFTYKDVLLLSQFLSPEGNILNRRVTGVCRKQQRKLEKAIEISRRLGLIPRKPPALLEKLQK